MALPLPAWITKLEGEANYFVVDPDLIFPQLAKELQVEVMDKYWLAIVKGCMQLDFNLAIAQAKCVEPGLTIHRHTRADDGRKGRWHPSLFEDGKPIPNGLQERGHLIKEHYKAIRGYIPA